jgi:hypothetical protein
MSFEALADEIRMIYESDPLRAETLIETDFLQRWKRQPQVERMALLETLLHQFEVSNPQMNVDFHLDREGFSRLFSLLLGKNVSTADLSSTELLEKLAHSFSTIFNTLNQIVGVIHATLLGEREELETIRHIIGSDLEREGGTEALQSYLDQIQKAFLVAHQALKKAAQVKMSEILTELDPNRIELAGGRGLKFGPLRKAELFEIYKEKYSKCKDWFESGRFMEELLREFEKTCQKLYNVGLRREK